jgi:hypothetical protein
MPGLYDSIQHASAHGGGTVQWSVGANAAGPYRVTDFFWQPRIVGDASAKLQSAGQWPTFRDVRVLEIQMEGTIVGANPGDYWVKRQSLAQSLIVPLGYNRAIRHHGTLTVGLPSVGAVWALVYLVDYSLPVAHDRASSSAYQFTWHADFGYWQNGGGAVRL